MRTTSGRAILALAGDVAGRRVLDAGCGSGALAAPLRERGALVTGADSSAGMLALARERLGPGVPLHQADLGEPLPFPDAAFDDVTASLVLHYLRDWAPVLREFRRVLQPAGRLIISTHHPFMDHALAGGSDYFATYNITEEWTKGGRSALMSFLAPAAACDDGRLHRGRVPSRDHQRAAAGPGGPRALPRRLRDLLDPAAIPFLRPARQLVPGRPSACVRQPASKIAHCWSSSSWSRCTRPTSVIRSGAVRYR
jgi:SAM-dependent methyltransferase